jgi:hypothetical protein
MTATTARAATTAPTDNAAFRALFSLPPIQHSTSTALIVPELPPRTVVTGDEEIDAVLWLREVIKTGQPELIAKARDAAKLIKTPLPALEKRYTQYLVSKHPGNFAAAFSSFGFAELDRLASRSVEKLARRDEALARFGSIKGAFAMTAAEQACETALKGMKPTGDFHRFNDKAAAKRFRAWPALVPGSLADCLHEKEYWSALYWLRVAVSTDGTGDGWPAGDAHDDFAFSCLTTIPPRSAVEAMQVLDFLHEREYMDRNETPAILRNLVSGGWRVKDPDQCIEGAAAQPA